MKRFPIIIAAALIIAVLLPAGILGSVRCADFSGFDPIERAARNPIMFEGPAPDFFSGAVLGNGGMGVIVCTRPDAVVFRFGHNNVWDIRVSEKNRDRIGTFREVFDRVAAIPDTVKNLEDDPWFKEYHEMARENYAKPYPRPFPCGSVILWFDPRNTEVLGHRVDPATGRCAVDMLVDGEQGVLEVFTDMDTDILRARMLDEAGNPSPAPFQDLVVMPDPSTPAFFPEWTAEVVDAAGSMGFRQVLPYTEVTEETPYRPHPKDRAFTLTASAGSPFISGVGDTAKFNPVILHLGPIPGERPPEIVQRLDAASPFVLAVRLESGLASAVGLDRGRMECARPYEYISARAASEDTWRAYWRKSGVALEDDVLERTWYHNLYFLRCSLREGATCPGLFANWSYGSIGTAWHGDYHMNYNTQQAFWAVFAANHPELHLPYADMVETYLLPVSKQWARDYYGMRGAFFPHSAYPVEMTMMPYPLPDWGGEVFETPWTVQSYWWHYLYTGDTVFLRERAFPAMTEAVLFLVDYMTRPEARGVRWGDDNYHIFPTVPPELYGLQPGFVKNNDTTADLALTRFLFDAWLKAVDVLGIGDQERATAADVRRILDHFPEWPTVDTPEGRIFVSVPGETSEIVYNCPANLMSIFPGEQHGLHSPPEILDTALRSYSTHRNEGGNDLIFLNIQGARLGVLDLERFKRHIAYCLLPDGTCTDMVRQVHGRYTNTTPFDFMAGMGIWFENFGLPAVIDECLMQSYAGEVRFFPNWPDSLDASFRTLRAAGAFLVSAEYRDGAVTTIEITSEKGGPLTIVNPWDAPFVTMRGDGFPEIWEGPRATIPTKAGETLVLQRK